MRKTSLKKRLAYLEDKQPFSYSEKETFSKSDRNFIRGIQVARNYTKARAIRYFRTIYGNRNSIRAIGEELQKLSDYGITVYTSSEMKEIKQKTLEEYSKPQEGKKYRYKYAGATKDIPESIKSRYILKITDTTNPEYSKRRYIDTETSEEISRYEHDKRLKKFKEGFGDI